MGHCKGRELSISSGAWHTEESLRGWRCQAWGGGPPRLDGIGSRPGRSSRTGRSVPESEGPVTLIATAKGRGRMGGPRSAPALPGDLLRESLSHGVANAGSPWDIMAPVFGRLLAGGFGGVAWGCCGQAAGAARYRPGFVALGDTVKPQSAANQS